MNYQETIDYLINSLPMFQRVGDSAFKKDLTNTWILCEYLGNPQNKFKSIHIAGTNGKGSTAHTLAAIFQVAGYRTGLYTSPHLKSFTERIKINGMPIGEKEVISFVADNKSFIEEIQPSFFEMTVALAFQEFTREKVDIAIIEVGMGGRFDSTNVITPELSVITNISLDHQAFLGDTLPKIAYEKAGIIKKNVPVVISEKQSQVKEVFIKKASDENAPIYFADDYFMLKNINNTIHELIFDVYKDKHLLFSEANFQMSGKYQVKNIPGILQAVDLMRAKGYHLDDHHILQGMRSVKSITGFKGRWDVLSTKPLTICDTAHNEGGIKQTIKQISSINYNKLHIVIGVVKDKDPGKILQLLPKDAAYYFTQATIPRAMSAHDLKAAALNNGLKGVAINNVNEAIYEAQKNASDDDLIFIGGSIFVIAEIEGL